MDLFKELIPMLNASGFSKIHDISDAEMKKVSPFIGMKVMSAVKGHHAGDALYLVNELTNHGFHDLTDHPKLQLMILSACATPGYNYYPGTRKKDKLTEMIRGFYPHWKNDEIQMMIDISSKEELNEMAADFAVQGKELKEWNKAVKVSKA